MPNDRQHAGRRVTLERRQAEAGAQVQPAAAERQPTGTADLHRRAAGIRATVDQPARVA